MRPFRLRGVNEAPPLLAQVRQEMGLHPDPLAAYRASGYAAKIAAERSLPADDAESGYPG